MSKKDGQKSDSNDNNNNASNNAIQTPKWRYVAMENTGNGVTTEVVMQWVGRQCTSNGGCRREEKSRKHWSLFTKLLSVVTANPFFLLDQIKSNCMY